MSTTDELFVAELYNCRAVITTNTNDEYLYEVAGHAKKTSTYKVFIEFYSPGTIYPEHRKEVNLGSVVNEGAFGTVYKTTSRLAKIRVVIEDSKGNPKTEALVPLEFPNQPPILDGVKDHRIAVGSVFDPLNGVTARDLEDGNITNKIVVTGNVNTTVPGTNILIYEVTDSGGLSAKETAVIEVVAPFNKDSQQTGNLVDDPAEYVAELFNCRAVITVDDRDEYIYEVAGHAKKTTSYKVYIEFYSPGTMYPEHRKEVNLGSKVHEGGFGTVYRTTSRLAKIRVVIEDGKGNPKTEALVPLEFPNQPPILDGVRDHTIAKGSVFDPLDGVIARDLEDGHITDKIVITGTVNTAVAGTYVLRYEVTDSGGLTAMETAVITVV